MRYNYILYCTIVDKQFEKKILLLDGVELKYEYLDKIKNLSGEIMMVICIDVILYEKFLMTCSDVNIIGLRKIGYEFDENENIIIKKFCYVGTSMFINYIMVSRRVLNLNNFFCDKKILSISSMFVKIDEYISKCYKDYIND